MLAEMALVGQAAEQADLAPVCAFSRPPATALKFDIKKNPRSQTALLASTRNQFENIKRC